MSSLYGGITQGITKSGIRAVICGQEGIGKTTLACNSPSCLLVPLEVGFASAKCAKTQMVKSFIDFQNFLNETEQYAKAGQLPFKTLVFDSATALERLIHDHVLVLDPLTKGGKTNTMESAHGGYAKAYTIANNLFSDVLKQSDVLALQYGINIVFTAHVFSAKIIDPTVGEYDSWDIQLHSPKNQKTYGKRELITQWVDLAAFLHEPVFISTDKESGVSLGISQQKGLVLGVCRKPSYVAKNRYGLPQIEIPIPCPPENGWNHLAQAIYTSSGIDVFTR